MSQAKKAFTTQKLLLAPLFLVPVNRLKQGPFSVADVAADGQRFLFALRVNTREELTMVLNWTAAPGKK